MTFLMLASALDLLITERTYLAAKLTELDRDGVVIRADYDKAVSLNVSKETGQVNSFDFAEVVDKSCTPQGCTSYMVALWFPLKSVLRDTCGSVRYVATAAADPTITLQLVDHAERNCAKMAKTRWEISVEKEGRDGRYFLGNPRRRNIPR